MDGGKYDFFQTWKQIKFYAHTHTMIARKIKWGATMLELIASDHCFSYEKMWLAAKEAIFNRKDPINR